MSEIPSQEEMLDLASKVMDSEDGFRQLLKEISQKIAQSERSLKVAESDLERAKAKLVAERTSHDTWKSFLGMMENLADKWGIKDLAVLPSKPRTQDDPDVAPVVQKTDPETQKRLDEGKLCMFRDQKTKKWCPTKLSSSQKKKNSDYCAKHHAIVFPN